MTHVKMTELGPGSFRLIQASSLGWTGVDDIALRLSLASNERLLQHLSRSPKSEDGGMIANVRWGLELVSVASQFTSSEQSECNTALFCSLIDNRV